MLFYILLAFVNGLLIAFARVLNSRLGETKGALLSSFWNHLVGFVPLVVIVLLTTGLTLPAEIGAAPLAAYFGGIIGGSFVALNSYVMPKIGVMRTILLVISGQMLTASILDLMTGAIASYPMQILGVSLILLGIVSSRLKRTAVAED